jgi:D-amino-acid dehydrogenase
MPVIVIGAGVIGVAAAVALRRDGHDVVLVDRGGPGRATSYGNMAGIGSTEFLPLSYPGVWRRLPRWLLDPTGPLALRPSYLPRALPWLGRFIWSGRPSRWREIAESGAALCRRALTDTRQLLEAAGLRHLLVEEGCLCLYANERERADDSLRLRFLREHDFEVRELSAAEISDLEPTVAPRFHSGVLLPQWQRVTNPYDVVKLLFECFIQAGGQFVTKDVIRLTAEAVEFADGSRLPFSTAVVAAGAWSGKLAATIGDQVPLESERGYHSDLPHPGVRPRLTLTWPAKAFVIVPIDGDKLRVGGTVEIAGLEAPPNFRRARVLLGHAKQILPALDTRDPSEWMGHRPALPDTIPVIGRSPHAPNVIYAFGHGHLGLTLAATTASLVADLAMQRPSTLDLSPYRVERF